MTQKKDIEDLMQYWNAYLAGDDNAFAIIYKKLVPDLFSFGLTLTSDNELVKDSIQDVFIWLLEKKEKHTSIKDLKLYLLEALKNRLFNEFKKQHTYLKFINSYDEALDIADESEEVIDDGWQHLSESELQQLIERFMSVLTKRQQEIIHYRYVDDLSIQEISDILNINYQSVANTIQRSLQKIQKFFLKKGV